MDTVAVGLWYFVTSALWADCKSARDFVKKYVGQEETDRDGEKICGNVSAAKYQELQSMSSLSAANLKKVQQFGRPDAYQLLKAVRKDQEVRSHLQGDINVQKSLEFLFDQRNTMAHGGRLEVNGEARKDGIVRDIMQNGRVLLNAVLQCDLMRNDSAGSGLIQRWTLTT